MNQFLKKFSIPVLVISLLLMLTACTDEIVLEDNVVATFETEEALDSQLVPHEGFSPGEIPTYDGNAFAVIGDNVPFFTEADLTQESFEFYSALDAYGRCGTAFASVGQDLMPTEERGSIGSVKPAGWHTVKYDFVDGKYLYNRCHLLGFQLTGENANEQNLITGTRYLNVQGMLPFENMVADYVRETGNHVLYRVTPIYDGSNLLCDGVLMEAWSVEDDGDGICFCIFAYNVQPGVGIDYATGDSWEEESFPTGSPEDTETTDYVLNISSGKFHYPDCPSVGKMKEKNKEYYTGSRDDLIAEGFEPCGQCKP